MIKRLFIKGTEDTPEVVLDRENAKFEISGRSLPENVNIFFEPVFNWITEYFNDPLKETVFSINLEYYNSSTAKKIVELLFIIESHFDEGCFIKIIWLYKKNDFTMQRKGEDLLSIFKIPNEINSF